MAMMTVLVATLAWLVISVVWTNDYYAFSKGARDGAEAGSVLLANFTSIQSTKAWVMPLEVLDYPFSCWASASRSPIS